MELPWMDQYFKQIKKIVREGKIATRIRVMLQDIIELRLNNWVSRGPEQGPITIVHKEAKIKEKEEPKKVQPQKDDKIQQGPWAQVSLVKGSGGGAKAGDSALQSSPSPQPSTAPQEKADFDGRRGNKNRNRRNRLYNLLHNAPAVSQPDPLTRGTSSKELLDGPAQEDEWYW
ncbi:unnamed protein product [Pleuronectes platessa]|uniref:Uncharacterized protein n=1 Tax=Pleuronectes platessa TaxID=8262 RepID=A0A9N7UE55_PLEPL|nr:unnamed protein product [Pleuronectes platessa]